MIFLRPFLPYIIGAGIAALVTASGAAWLGWQRVDHWKGVAEAAEARERAARATIELLRAEMESDNAIDQIPDDSLGGAVDPRWLLEVRPR